MLATTQNKITGLLLIASAILTVGTYLITPGLALVDPVETTDLINWGRVLHENAALSFFALIVSVLGLLLQFLGVFGLRRVTAGDSAGDTIARFSVLSLAVGIVVAVIERGMTYTVVQTLEYGVGAGAGPDQSQLLNLIAITVLTTENGISLIGFYAVLLGLMGLGIGFLGRIQSYYYKTVSGLMALACFVSLTFATVISPFYGLAHTFYYVFALAIGLGNLWFAMMGVALWKGMPELSEEYSPA